MRDFLLNIKRGDTPTGARLRGLARAITKANLPQPRPVAFLARGMYQLHFAVWHAVRRFISVVYAEPLFRSRCVQAGKRLNVFLLPHVSGHTRIYIGDDVNIFGKVGIASGRVFDDPTLIIKSRVDIGHLVTISVNKEIVIEEECNIANNVTIADNDAHPRDHILRALGEPPGKHEVKPVHICRNAWIGAGCYIHKGVTIGEGAIIGSNSVVVTDIPAFAIAMGNPARVVIKDSRKIESTPSPTADALSQKP